MKMTDDIVTAKKVVLQVVGEHLDGPVKPEKVLRITKTHNVTDEAARAALWYLIDEGRLYLNHGFEIALSDRGYSEAMSMGRRWKTMRVPRHQLTSVLCQEFGLADDVEVIDVVFDEETGETEFTLRSVTYPINELSEP